MKKLNTGICISLPENFYGFIIDKSSLASKGLLTLGKVINKDYTGEIIVTMTSLIQPIKIKKGLEFITEIQKQAKIHNQIWNKIKDLINSVDGVNFRFSDYFRVHGIIIFDTDDTLPLEDIVSIYSITIIIESVYRDYYDRFYPQIHLENCIYKKC